MNLTETAQLLTLASIVDHRNVATETVNQWHRLVGHLPFALARDAMEIHLRESTEYLRPAHVNSIARRIRETRGTYDTTPALPRGRHAPKPVNWDPMSWAWNQPDRWEYELDVYDLQLQDAGHARLVRAA